MTVDRREFLAQLGVSASALTLASCGNEPELTGIAGDPNDPSLVWDKAPCRYCGTGCGVEVGVRDGRVKAVRGDQANPVNRGLLCVKGYHLPAMLYGRDRPTREKIRLLRIAIPSVFRDCRSDQVVGGAAFTRTRSA